MHRKVEENLANIEKPSSIYGTVEDMVNRAGGGRGGGAGGGGSARAPGGGAARRERPTPRGGVGGGGRAGAAPRPPRPLAKDMERNLVYCPSGEILRFSQYL